MPQQAMAQSGVRVYLLDATGIPTREGLVQALRIQLHGVASLHVGGRVPAGSMAIQAQQGRVACQGREDGIAVWLGSQPSSQGTVLLHVAECAGDRVLVELISAPPGEAAATDRAVALKVRSLLEFLREDHREADVSSTAPLSDGGLSPTAFLALSALPPLLLGQLVDVGFSASLGARYRVSAMAVSLGGGVRLQPKRSVARDGDRLQATSIAPGLLATVLFFSNGYALSVESAVFLRRLSVTAETAAGAPGELTARLAQVELTAGIGAEIGLGLLLEVRLGGLCNLSRRRFAVNGRTLGDTGYCGPLLSLAARY